MARPDYGHWDLINEFDLDHAAALCCDIEPEIWNYRTNPAPAVVMAMKRTLESECPDKVSRETVTRRYDPFGPDSQWYSPPRERITKTWTRPALRAWAERTGRLGAMPYLLTPEERQGTPKPGLSTLRADASANLNALVGLLTLALVKRGGPGFRQTIQGREGPNLSAVAKELRDLANERGIDTTGLSFKSLTDRLNAGQAELEERR